MVLLPGWRRVTTVLSEGLDAVFIKFTNGWIGMGKPEF